MWHWFDWLDVRIKYERKKNIKPVFVKTNVHTYTVIFVKVVVVVKCYLDIFRLSSESNINLKKGKLKQVD